MHYFDFYESPMGRMLIVATDDGLSGLYFVDQKYYREVESDWVRNENHPVLMYKAAFGTWFSWQNSLSRAAPLVLTALCTALPAQMGMVIIGGEGALVLGGLAAIAAGLAVKAVSASPLMAHAAMAVAAMGAGGLLIAFCGWLRQARGVNETISSLLVGYIAIAIMNQVVEGPMRDPTSLNKPSTRSLGEGFMLGNIPGMDVHWGLAFGVILCVFAYILVYRTTFGFSARIVGGNARAARLAGLPVTRMVLVMTFLAGAAAGLAGMAEVAAVQGRANASLAVGYGFTGILVAFLARQNPIAILPVAVLLGGIGASSGMLQRRVGLPDATVLVLQGIIFICILASETFFGRFKVFQPRGGDQ